MYWININRNYHGSRVDDNLIKDVETPIGTFLWHDEKITMGKFNSYHMGMQILHGDLVP